MKCKVYCAVRVGVRVSLTLTLTNLTLIKPLKIERFFFFFSTLNFNWGQNWESTPLRLWGRPQSPHVHLQNKSKSRQTNLPIRKNINEVSGRRAFCHVGVARSFCHFWGITHSTHIPHTPPPARPTAARGWRSFARRPKSLLQPGSLAGSNFGWQVLTLNDLSSWWGLLYCSELSRLLISAGPTDGFPKSASAEAIKCCCRRCWGVALCLLLSQPSQVHFLLHKHTWAHADVHRASTNDKVH